MNIYLAYILITIISFSVPLMIVRFGKPYLTALLPIYLIVANVFALSFVKFFNTFQTSLAVPIYSATFLVTNIISEHFGKEEAKKAIWIGFMGQILLVFLTILIINTPLNSVINEAYNKVFSTLPRLIAGSFIAYIISHFLDIIVFKRLKDRFKWLWLRNNVSTMFAQLIDTTLIIYIAFWDVPPFTTHAEIWNFILTTWVIKSILSILDTPFIYYSNKLLIKR